MFVTQLVFYFCLFLQRLTKKKYHNYDRLWNEKMQFKSPLQSSMMPMITRIAIQISLAYVNASCMRTAALTLTQLTIVMMAKITKNMNFKIANTYKKYRNQLLKQYLNFPSEERGLQ